MVMNILVSLRGVWWRVILVVDVGMGWGRASVPFYRVVAPCECLFSQALTDSLRLM